MSRKAAAAAVAGALGVAALGVGLPAASATTSSESSDDTSISDRVEAIKDALAGLVGDGTLTQEQADEVASTLEDSDALRHGPGGWHGGHGGPWGGLEAAATALGIEEEELRTALQDGASLAEVAEEKGVETSQLVDALVAEATEGIEDAVADEDLTREQADEILAELPDRVTQFVEEGFGDRGDRGGWGGHRGGPWGWDGDDESDSSEEESSEDSSDGSTSEGDVESSVFETSSGGSTTAA
ncbi:hypothetical protein [Quadrisphaera sp. DSM 44207]|uniref:hypothetical protein n=1 Tax=Quadrisphaera sp. DSM 44207 TaxID=1881057 RepID=UPI000B859160|nr:hypothetical protein [Quadrisphaera sp. DSM 44207]